MAATITSIPTTKAKATPATKPAYFSLASNQGEGRNALIALLASLVVAIAAYWEVLTLTAAEWSQPQYSHGWIIPLIGLGVLWARRERKASIPDSDREMQDLLMRVAGAMAALMVVGKSTQSALLSGVGLGGLCLSLLAGGLLGQPFAPGWRRSESSGDVPLLAITGVSAAIFAVGMAKGFGLPIPGPHAGYIQVAALATLMLGSLAVSGLTKPPTRMGMAEAVFAGVMVMCSVVGWVFAVQVDMAPLFRFSFITVIFGLFAMVGGLRLIRWAGAPVAFCLFMYPLPSILENRLLPWLQGVAVAGAESAYLLIGVNVTRDGNRLEVQGIPMEVIEACSGLSMSTILAAMAVAMVMVVKRPVWDKLVILLSALPIAIVANIFRIVMTGFIWILADVLIPMEPEAAQSFRDTLHGYAGIVLMMPFALGLYWLELTLLSMLTVEEEGIEASQPAVVKPAEGAATS
ncbi:MAG: exosortase/archaeosortase family protein [Planctomycetota bacterium]